MRIQNLGLAPESHVATTYITVLKKQSYLTTVKQWCRKVLPDDNPARDDGILHVSLEDPVQLGEGGNQVRPLRRGFEILQTSVHLSDIAETERNKNKKIMKKCAIKLIKSS
jgi:hypothetical protein